jgi:hypothetical protein
MIHRDRNVEHRRKERVELSSLSDQAYPTRVTRPVEPVAEGSQHDRIVGIERDGTIRLGEESIELVSME